MGSLMRRTLGLTILSSVVALLLTLFVATDRMEAQPTSTAFYPVYSKTPISTNATTLVLSGAGVLHAICVNDLGASSNTATVYDALTATGTAFAIIDTVTVDSNCLVYDAAISTGITVVTATGTAGHLTVLYRALR